MDIQGILKNLEGCSCGQDHGQRVQLKAVEIGHGLLGQTADILKKNGFPTKILAVADKNTLKAAEGILEILKGGGFDYTLKLYDDLRTADMTEVNAVASLSGAVDGILSIGSGSLNDICRLAALKADKKFAIFATAPSMDGFASDSAPITDNNFKVSYPARCPEIIIGDTAILAAAPAELKSAGFGDIIAKYVAIVDWKISTLVSGEYYCGDVLALTKAALEKLMSLADKVTQNDEETAQAIMEALVVAGLAMTLAGCTRPGSGTEHIISHFWEIKKLEEGHLSDYHGKKVGVATLLVAKVYHELVNNTEIRFHEDNTDWEKVYQAYGPNFKADVQKTNSPTITEQTSPQRLKDNWQEIQKIIRTELPTYPQMLDLMNRAGAATTLEEISVSKELGITGLTYHPYMRQRLTLMRLIPMLTDSFDFARFI